MELDQLVNEHEEAKQAVEAATVALMESQERLKAARAALAQELGIGNGGAAPKPPGTPFDESKALAWLKKQDEPVLIRQLNTALGTHASRADMEGLISSGKVKMTGKAPSLYYRAA